MHCSDLIKAELRHINRKYENDINCFKPPSYNSPQD